MVDLRQIADSISYGSFSGVTIFLKDERWMVSMKTEGGFQTYYGSDLPETFERALSGGHQNEDDGMDLI